MRRAAGAARARSLVRAAALGAALAAFAAGAARAHWLDPDQLVAELRSDRLAAVGVVGAERDARLPRLLVVHVGPGWDAVTPDARRDLAEAWRAHWREALPDGVLAIVDAGGRSRVGFDPGGHAQLHDPPR